MADRKPLVLAAGGPAEIPAGDTLGIANGGTGATTQALARTALGIATGTRDYVFAPMQPGTATAGVRMLVHELTAVITLPAGLVGSFGTALVAATASAAFVLAYKRAGATTTIATFTFPAAGTEAALSDVAIPVLQVGDVLILTAPATADATLADIGFSILCSVPNQVVNAPGVTTFNTRAGAVTLVGTDVSAAGGVLSSDTAALFASPGPIGSTAASTGTFTTLSATSTISGVGFSTYLASPPTIGGTAAAPGTFTTLTSTGYHVQSIATGLTATGTTQATALVLAKQFNVISTAAASSGVRLPNAGAGAEVVVINRGANTINIYPPTGGVIDALAANAATTAATVTVKRFVQATATQYYAV